MVLAPLVAGRKGHYKDLFETLLKKGYRQVRVDGEIFDVGDLKPLDRYKNHFIELVIDKLVPSEEDYKRISDSVASALHQGKGTLAILEYDKPDAGLRYFSSHLMCPESGISFSEPAPHTFSFNSPQGACPKCKGLGYVSRIDMKKIISNPSKSIHNGGIDPLGSYKDNNWFRILESMAKVYSFSLNEPIKDLPEDVVNMIIYGTDELFRVNLADGTQLASFPGVLSKIEQSSNEKDDIKARRERFVEESVCPECNGTRLKKDSLYFKIDGLDISQVSNFDIDELKEWIEQLPAKLNNKQNLIASDILKELRDRVGFLQDVGLNYLSLSRSTRSLSGGESQRIRLATQIGSKLVNVLYILDEPSIGLQQRDNRKLINSLKALRDEGNSVMVVKHD